MPHHACHPKATRAGRALTAWLLRSPGEGLLRPKRSHVMDQVPNVLVGLDPAKRGHPAQPNAVFIIQNNSRSEYPCTSGPVRSAARGAHPPPGVRGRVAVGAVTHRTVCGVPFVAFFDARRQHSSALEEYLPGCSNQSGSALLLSRPRFRNGRALEARRV